MALSKAQVNAWEFFHANAGGVVGSAAIGAWRLAQAEATAASRELSFTWEHDPYADHSWCDIKRPHEHEVLSCAVRDRDGRVLASLSGIFDAGRKYARVVEAELALEALEQIKAPVKHCATCTCEVTS